MSPLELSSYLLRTYKLSLSKQGNNFASLTSGTWVDTLDTQKLFVIWDVCETCKYKFLDEP